jgi:ketosteroid isomerase-like protein
MKKDVAAVETAFHQAILAADVKTLATLLDENFIWTHRTGEQMLRQQLLERLGSGQLKYTKLETTNVTVNVYGDTAVVRGASPVNMHPLRRPHRPWTLFYTLTFVNRDGSWKAVAMPYQLGCSAAAFEMSVSCYSWIVFGSGEGDDPPNNTNNTNTSKGALR